MKLHNPEFTLNGTLLLYHSLEIQHLDRNSICLYSKQYGERQVEKVCAPRPLGRSYPLFRLAVLRFQKLKTEYFHRLMEK